MIEDKIRDKEIAEKSHAFGRLCRRRVLKGLAVLPIAGIA